MGVPAGGGRGDAGGFGRCADGRAAPWRRWLFFAGSLFPALGFFNVYPFLFSYVADHFQYLAMLGVVAAAAAALALGMTRPAAWVRWSSWTLAAAVIGLLGVRANRESTGYRDAATLYRATLARNPACWMAHNNLGVILAASPATEAEAVAHYREALRLYPDYAEAHNNLALELSKTPGHEMEAIEHCLRALRIHPDYAEAHCNLANVLVTMPGHESEVLANYEEALRLAPKDARVHYGFANALVKMPGHLEAGIAQYEEALRLSPDYVEAHSNLADELARLPGRQPDALRHYREALRIDPTRPESHYNLSVELAKMPGHEAEAVAELMEALRLRPDYPKAHNNLGVLYARQGKLDEARRQWEKTLQLDAGNEDARRNLQRLAAAAGKMTKMRPGLKSWTLVALVFAVALGVYWPALHGGLVWDDDAHVTRADLRGWTGLGRIWTELHATQQYYPVLHSAFWVEHRLWGDATLGYHLVNVLLHATAACLLALALLRLKGDRLAAWLAALLFAVHPVCVESVAWISEQKNTLSLVFYLLAALVYLDFDARRRWTSYAGALGLFVLALGTKSVTATLPAALLVVLWWRKGSLSWRGDVAAAAAMVGAGAWLGAVHGMGGAHGDRGRRLGLRFDAGEPDAAGGPGDLVLSGEARLAGGSDVHVSALGGLGAGGAAGTGT